MPVVVEVRVEHTPGETLRRLSGEALKLLAFPGELLRCLLGESSTPLRDLLVNPSRRLPEELLRRFPSMLLRDFLGQPPCDFTETLLRDFPDPADETVVFNVVGSVATLVLLRCSPAKPPFRRKPGNSRSSKSWRSNTAGMEVRLLLSPGRLPLRGSFFFPSFVVDTKGSSRLFRRRRDSALLSPLLFGPSLVMVEGVHCSRTSRRLLEGNSTVRRLPLPLPFCLSVLVLFGRCDVVTKCQKVAAHGTFSSVLQYRIRPKRRSSSNDFDIIVLR